MKKFILSILTLFFITFYSCDKEEMYNDSNYVEDLDIDGEIESNSNDDDDGDNDDGDNDDGDDDDDDDDNK